MGATLQFAAVAAGIASAVGAVLPNNTLVWKPLGEPGCGGDITAVRINPYNTSQVFMAGDMLGVGVSLDGGETWLSPHTTSFPSYEMSDFSFDPVLQRIYVASLHGPYFATFADPLTWVNIREGFPPSGWGTYEGTTQVVLVDPTSGGQRLMAFGGDKRGWDRLGGLGRIWESTNAGANWTLVANLTDAKGNGGNIVYAGWCGPACVWAAASGAGMFQSVDGGRTWANRSAGLNTDMSFGSAAAHPSDPNTAYVAMCDGSGVFKTTDGGGSWAPANSGLATGNGCYEAFGMAPSDPNTLYAGSGNVGGNAWVTRDGGASWTPTGAPPAAQAYGLGLQASFLAVHPTDAATVLYATWVTLWRTTDGGANWNDLTAFAPVANDTTGTIWRGTGYSGLVSTNVEWNPYSSGSPRAFVQGMDAGKIWAAVDDTLYAWRRQSGLNEFGGGNDVTFAADGTTVFAGTGQAGWSSAYSVEGVVKSVDGGNTWAYACGHPNITGTVTGWAVHVQPYNASSLWAVFGDRQLYFSANGCANWTLLTSLNDTVYNIEAAPVPGGNGDPAAAVLFVAGNKGVWVTGPGWTAGLHEWTLLPGGPTAWEYSTNWCVLAAGAADKLVCANAWWDQWHSGLWVLNLTQARAHAATGAGSNGWTWALQDNTIYRWSDTAASGGLVQAYASNLNPYPEATTATGVWLSIDGGASWSMQAEGLRMTRVAALRFSPDGTRLVAGLNGGGFYVADTSALLALAKAGSG